VQPLTGRTHQIRVHMAQYLHAPIIGDFKYGAMPIRELDINYRKLYLHARTIEFQNSLGENIKVTAPFDGVFQQALQSLDFQD
jgi:23S rRNA pseudouridine955/2504/2580 synthase